MAEYRTWNAKNGEVHLSPIMRYRLLSIFRMPGFAIRNSGQRHPSQPQEHQWKGSNHVMAINGQAGGGEKHAKTPESGILSKSCRRMSTNPHFPPPRPFLPEPAPGSHQDHDARGQDQTVQQRHHVCGSAIQDWIAEEVVEIIFQGIGKANAKRFGNPACPESPLQQMGPAPGRQLSSSHLCEHVFQPGQQWDCSQAATPQPARPGDAPAIKEQRPASESGGKKETGGVDLSKDGPRQAPG